MVYLADSVKESQKIIASNYQYYLQPGDRVEILVTALNPLAAQAFNIVVSNNTTSGQASLGSPGSSFSATPSTSGYLIDKNGNINFPELGDISVAGLTTDSVASKIQTTLLQYLKQPTVIVNLLNFKVNVLGEVNRPGTIVVPDGKISILEAISQSGDLTIFGKRENILVVREKNGQRAFGRVDLTSNNIFNSPFFYLEQGDVVYVELNRNKLLANDALAARNVRNISLALAFITSAALVYNVLK